MLALRLLAIGVIVAAGFVAAGTPRVPSASRGPKSLVIISVDTLRRDHLSIYGYERPTSPAIDAFFGEGEIYERAYSAESNTPPSVISILTGLYPPGHGVRLFLQQIDDDVTTIADVVSSAGYQTAAVVSNSVLASESIGLDRRFAHYDDAVTEREGIRPVWERRAGPTTDAALEWLDEARKADEPFFLWVHYNDPHGPYDPPEGKPTDFAHDGEQLVSRKRIPGYIQIPDTPRDALEYIDRYDEEIAYLDSEVGRLLHRIEELPDDVVVVLTADHGETMVEHEQYFSHGFHVWEPLVGVPLLVRRPGAPARRIRQAVSLVDLAPSVLQYLGTENLDKTDGFLLGTRPADEPIAVEAWSYGSQVRAFVVGRQKWFVRVGADRTIVDRNYTVLDGTTEAWEAGSWSSSTAASRLEESVLKDPDPGGIPAEYAKGRGLEGPKVAPAKDARQREALRALGYLE